MHFSLPNPFAETSQSSAKTLHKAIFGKDRSSLIAVLAPRGPADMANLSQAYQHDFGTDMVEDAKKELEKDHFGHAVVNILRGPFVYDCYLLNKAVGHLLGGLDEEVISQVLIGRTNADVQKLKDMYHALYGKELVKQVQSMFQGNLSFLYTTILQATREEEPAAGVAIDPTTVDTDVEVLYKAGAAKFGTDENAFIRVLANRSNAHLRLVFHQYQQKYGRSMRQTVESEFSGKIKSALVALVLSVENPALGIAEQFEASMASMGTDEHALTRVAVRNHWNREFMTSVKKAYKTKYNKELHKRITGDTSGSYENLLLALIGD